MAQTPTERVTAVERIVDTHSTRLYLIEKEADALHDAHKELAKEFADLKRDFDRETALLKREIEELRKWKEEVRKAEEEWGRKLWMIVPPLLAVLVSTLLSVLIMLYFKK